MSYFKYQEKKVYYEEYGSGEAVILLHGNTVSGKFFAPVLPKSSFHYARDSLPERIKRDEAPLIRKLSAEGDT